MEVVVEMHRSGGGGARLARLELVSCRWSISMGLVCSASLGIYTQISHLGDSSDLLTTCWLVPLLRSHVVQARLPC